MVLYSIAADIELRQAFQNGSEGTPVSHNYKPSPSGGEYDNLDPTFVISVTEETGARDRYAESAAGNYEEPVVRLNGSFGAGVSSTTEQT